MAAERPPRNDGWTSISYSIVPDRPETNEQISVLLNEAWHVHRHHHDGAWKKPNGTKDSFAAQLALLIRDDRSLIQALLGFGDRMLSMLTYRALELLDTDVDLESLLTVYWVKAANVPTGQ